MISKVSDNIAIPAIVGGGITSPEKVFENARAGANIVVVGNAIERDPLLIRDMAQAAKAANSQPRTKKKHCQLTITRILPPG
jgi:heptaprenylglyceryl phosphate synthase